MSLPPPIYPEKPKQRRQGGVPLSTFILLFFMVMLGILIGGSAMLLSAPTLYNFAATQMSFGTRAAALELTGQALAATEVELLSIVSRADAQATSQAQALLATQAAQAASIQLTNNALANAQQLLAQTATQSQVNVYATATANAILGERQMTQVALDYSATQAQLNQNATQVELNYQATRAALNVTPQAGAQGAPNAALPTASSAPPRNTAALVITAQPTSAATYLPFDTTATPGPTVVAFADTFDTALRPDFWLISDAQEWLAGNGALTANRDNAWLLTRRSFGGDYTFAFTFTPALLNDATYHVLLNVSNGDGVFVRLNALSLSIVNVAVYRFNGGLPIAGVGELIAERPARIELLGNSVAEFVWQGSALSVTINGVLALPPTEVNAPPRGTVGLQLPAGTVLAEVMIR